MARPTLLQYVDYAVGLTHESYPLTPKEVMELTAVIPETDDVIQLVKSSTAGAKHLTPK